MQLVEFIQNNHERILSEWESFARTLLPASAGMNKAGLRDHADEILTAVVRDMDSLQSKTQEADKSKGLKTDGHIGALGEFHASLRIDKGFTLMQVVAEYRALRASVLRLWETPDNDPKGVLRFNEAIDEALAVAVEKYAKKTDQYRDQLIGIVSHDLRNPLGGILMASGLLTRAEGLTDKNSKIASGIQTSAKRMVRIVADLIDLTRTRLGMALPIIRSPIDIDSICQLVIAELQASHPSAVLRYASSGNMRGEWDGDRLAQVLSNLIGNALQHGDAKKPICVVANDDRESVVVTVHNAGSPIPVSELRNIFEPMVCAKSGERTSTGLGLGLYIASEVVTAHGGTIDVTSTDADGTTFTVHLPRHAAA